MHISSEERRTAGWSPSAAREEARRRAEKRMAELEAQLAGFKSQRARGAQPLRAALAREREKAAAAEEAARLEAAAAAFLARRLPAGVLAAGPEAAMTVLPALCRQESIAVRFEGRPSTDMRTIWLGPVDFTSPLAPVYVWGHGIHERNHVRYSDMAALSCGASVRVRRLANLFEDARVDALGLADYPGWRIWRETLVHVLTASGRCLFGRRRCEPQPELFSGWLLMHLMRDALGLELPDEACRETEAAAEAAFGSLLEKMRSLVSAKLPLADSADARALAEEAAELLDAEAVSAELDEREARLRAAERSQNEAAQAAWRRTEARRQALQALSDEGRWSIRPEAGAAKTVRRSRKDAGLCAPEDDWSEGLHGLRRLLTVPEGFPAAAQAVGSLERTLRASAAADAWQRGEASPEIAAAAEESGFELANGASWALAQSAAQAFDAVWAASSAFGAAVGEALRRPGFEPEAWSEAGFDLDHDRLDLLAAGDARIFRSEAEVLRCAPAVQILLDLSASVGDSEAAVLKTAALRLEEALKREVRARCRIAVFPDAGGEGVFLASDWTSPPGTALTALRPLAGRGPTPLVRAMLWGAMSLAEAGAAFSASSRHLVVLTDGRVRFEDLERPLGLLAAIGAEAALLFVRRPDADAAALGDGTEAFFMDEREAAEAAKRLYGASWRVASGWEAVPEALLALLAEMRLPRSE